MKQKHEIKDIPNNYDLKGHIIYFADPLQVEITIEHKEKAKDGKGDWIHYERTGKIVPCKFMRATGGFGTYYKCSGRMICGEFFENLQDVLDNKPVQGGNTKCFPTGYIPDLFVKQK
jgi:hypothetical protein